MNGIIVNIVNPNLFSLSQLYYGSTIYWAYIAQANGLQIANPIGVFTLTIPSLPV